MNKNVCSVGTFFSLSHYAVHKFRIPGQSICDKRSGRATASVYYIVSGSVDFDTPKGALHAESGDMLYIPRRQRYTADWTGCPDIVFYGIDFGFDIKSEFGTATGNTSVHDNYILQKCDKSIFGNPDSTFENLYNKYCNPAEHGFDAVTDFYSFFAKLLGGLDKTVLTVPDSPVEAAALYIEQHSTDEFYIDDLAKMCVEETGMGRVSDKIIKHQLVANKTPGTEDLHPSAFSGDCGLTLIEMAPYGVIGSITPSTNPSETVICNSIGMIAGGNAVVFNPHPNACKVANYAVDLVNRAILEAGGPENLVVTVEKPTKESSDEMMASPIVKMLVATGGPGVVKALLSSGKKAIGAGAGNPPVIVDDTANIEKAAKDIVAGASFDNNLPCIAEKECFAFDNIADDLIKYMTQNGAYLIKGEQIDQLVKVCLVEKNGKYCINKDWVGRDASKFLKAIGIESDARLVIAEVPNDHPFVYVEMMMPVLGIVRVKNIDEAIELACKAEHGNRHSAHIHSKNVDHLTRFARAVETTIFVKNAPSYAGIGAGGEGYTTFTIAGPTGEGLTAAHSFTRQRRCVLVDGFHIV